jgi:hypothetical protein
MNAPHPKAPHEYAAAFHWSLIIQSLIRHSNFPRPFSRLACEARLPARTSGGLSHRFQNREETD